ncbi:hypothetical protein BE17_12180 [Sorangium cellulosum]|uniref:Uncharacterized protein n=1 Tax=Sorangium cellulosum TaxID=56 RepID=A0A150RIA2_SORCE|nr:hypothetical protein BE17_12180 [Sorangium cellulosum]
MNDVGIEGDCNVDAMVKRSWTPAFTSGDPARDPWLSAVLPGVQDASRGVRAAARGRACGRAPANRSARWMRPALLSLAEDPTPRAVQPG